METLSKAWRGIIVFALTVAVGVGYVSDTTRPITSNWRTLSQASLLERWMAPVETNAFRRPGLLPPYTLMSVALGPDGRTAIAVGDNGTALRSADAGATWVKADSTTTDTLTSVALGPDGRTAIAVSFNGTALRSADAGATWVKADSTTTDTLRSVALGPDGRTAIAVGSSGTALRSADAGATWEPVRYGRAPSPAFWIGFVAALVLTVWLWRGGWIKPNHRDGIEGIGVDDGPIDDATKDRLGINPIARALARFLANEATRPSLVIAVQAPWGRGKSSLMNLLREAVAERQMRTVWFNAWHQQSDDGVLASLLDAIREHGLPSAWTADGLRFRGHLLCRRFKNRHPRWLTVAALMVIAGFAGLSLAVIARSAVWSKALKNLPATEWWPATWAHVVAADAIASLSELLRGDLGPQLDDPKLFATLGQLFGMPEVLAVLGALLLLVVGGWLLIVFGLRAFPESPAALLASTSTKFRLGDAQAQTSFRERFRRHFKDVSETLRPNTLTLFIDDIDRCTPERALLMLEAVNYLTTNGECFVVLGVAREVLEAQLAQALGPVADQDWELRAADDARSGTNAEDTEAQANQARQNARLNYARKYLRKLIQIEVDVPQFSHEKLAELAEQVRAEKKEESDRPKRTADKLVILWLWWTVANASQGFRGLAKLAIGGLFATALFGAGSGVTDWVSQAQQAESKRVIALAGAKNDASAGLLEAREVVVRLAEAELPPDPAPGVKRSSGTKKAGSTPAVAVDETAVTDESTDARAVGGATEDRTAKPATSIQKELPAIACGPSDKLPRTKQGLTACIQTIQAEFALLETKAAQIDKLPDGASDRTIASATKEFATVAERLKQRSVALDESLKPESDNDGQTNTEVNPNPQPAVPFGSRTASADAPVDLPSPLWQWALIAPFGVVLLFILLRRENPVERDTRDFIKAFRIWTPLALAEQDNQTPREVKRFINLARYSAARLSAPVISPTRLERLRQLSEPTGKASVGTVAGQQDNNYLPPEEVVAMAAMVKRHGPAGIRRIIEKQARNPQHLLSAILRVSIDGDTFALTKPWDEHDKTFGTALNVTPKKILDFLEAVSAIRLEQPPASQAPFDSSTAQNAEGLEPKASSAEAPINERPPMTASASVSVSGGGSVSASALVSDAVPSQSGSDIRKTE